MNDAEKLTEKHCPECGAPVGAVEQNCWLCNRSGGSGQEPISPVTVMARRKVSFSLGSLMTAMTLICVCLGLFGIAPGLGIGFASVVMPAFIRTARGAARRRVEGQPMDISEKMVTFGGSVGVVTVIGVAAGVTFCATCSAGGWAIILGMEVLFPRSYYDGLLIGFGTGVVLGCIAGGYVGYRLLRKLWPQND